MLRDRLARQLGSEADTASGRVTESLLDRLEQQAADLKAENAHLRQQIAELEGALRESGETVEAARAMNRELMAEINRPVRPDPPARPSARSNGGLPAKHHSHSSE